jgi:hypothetical protein
LDEAGSILAQKARVMAAAAATPSPTRRQARRVTYLIVALSVIVGLTLFELAGGLAHARDRPLALTVRLADGWALASAVLTWLVVRRATPLVRDGDVLALLLVAAPLVLLGWMARFHLAYVDAPPVADWPCFVGALTAAAAPLAGLSWARRKAEPRRPGMLGAAIGASCGAWAGVLALLWCPHTGLEHALAGHVAPLVATTVLGAITGVRVLRMRRGSP